MSALRRFGALAALAVLLAAATPRRERPLEVAILAPDVGEPAFGEVEVLAAVNPAGAPVDRVELYLDGMRVHVLTQPPWQFLVDVGEQNVPHHIEVLAFSPSGARSSASVRTGVITAQDEIEVKLRPLFVRVDRDGVPVTGLTREDFAVYDEGVRQEIVTFERGDVPFTAVLLLDASVSMEGAPLAQAIGGVTAFARAMQRMDEAKLLLFADRVLLESPFTGSPTLLTVGASTVDAGGGTALNDALYLGLGRLEPRSGRKVVLLLSDGVDVESVLSMTQVQALARRSPVILYWLRLGGEPDPAKDALPSYTPWRDSGAHGVEKRLLREVVVESGGRVVPVHHTAQVREALATVLEELRDQYVLGYHPSVHRGSGAWHEVRVEVGGGAYQVRTHRGYLEP